MTLTRLERDSFTTTTPTDIAYGEGACLETPKFVFDQIHKRFHFDVDLTANENNHLLPYWFGPGAPPACQDALTQDWTARLGMRVIKEFPDGAVGGWIDTVDPRCGYSNPPYGDFIPKILTKALEERAKGFTSVFLLPMRAGGWYKDLVLPYYSELWHLSTRLAFPYLGAPRIDETTKLNRKRMAWNLAHPDKPQKVCKPDGALFDSIIVVYAPIVAPLHRVQGELFHRPPGVRPNVWDPKTGELRY